MTNSSFGCYKQTKTKLDFCVGVGHRYLSVDRYVFKYHYQDFGKLKSLVVYNLKLLRNYIHAVRNDNVSLVNQILYEIEYNNNYKLYYVAPEH